VSLLIQAATEADIPAAAGVIAEALQDDATVRALVPGTRDRVRRLTRFYAAVIKDEALPSGVVDIAWDEPSHQVLGAAIWEGPERRVQFLRKPRMLPTYIRLIGFRDLPTTLRTLRQLEAYHPDFQHWYLSDIGVSATARGRGVGGELLRHRLAAIDAQRLPTYLEATTPMSRRLYERHGFAVSAMIGLTSDGYPAAMIRPAVGTG
jgi:ribosomal protein S18 acetylase RimI-like enzyme